MLRSSSTIQLITTNKRSVENQLNSGDMNENKLNRYLFINKLNNNKDKSDIDVKKIKEIK